MGINGKREPKNLHEAILYGTIEDIKIFVDRGANTSEFDEDGSTTPLIACITNGNPLRDLNYLLERGANVNVETTNGETAILVAAEKGNEESVELLLQKDAIIDVVNNDGETPLMLACRSGHLEVVRVLLDYGAKIFLTKWPDFEFSALHYATLRKPWRLDIILLLLEKVDPMDDRRKELNTLLFKAISFNCLELVQELLHRGVSQNAEFSAMNYAANCGNRKILNYLITHGGDIDEEDLLGFTPLMNAARQGHEEIAELLLSAGADVHKVHKTTGFTPAYIALLNGNVAIWSMIRWFSLIK
ncbi:unnamed protein product [Rodentolepis nana]|uniref:ANK_REP_REGION domain-containing protein n=1 Tax=Rodentolepis nana TaxID=102285 RepID=A0A0R3T6P8_RODNA|nr:unnamed protein product [Rodentolepis nana]